MNRRRWSSTPAFMIGLVAALAGCVSAPPASSTCVDWVWFETPEAAAAEADRVAIGTVDAHAGTRERYGETVNVWRVTVTDWIVGDGESTIDVVSSPRTCESGSPYPGGDPLDTDGEVMLFLRDTSESVSDTITGLQGVIPAPQVPEIPADWPATR